jgi:hypothetical protein
MKPLGRPPLTLSPQARRIWIEQSSYAPWLYESDRDDMAVWCELTAEFERLCNLQNNGDTSLKLVRKIADNTCKSFRYMDRLGFSPLSRQKRFAREAKMKR